MMYTCESPEFWGCVTISPALLHTKALFWGVSVQVVNTWYAHSASLIGLIRKRTLFLQGSFVFWDSAAKEPYFWSIFPTYRHLTCTLGKPTRTLPQKNTYLAGLFCILELLHKRALFLEVFFQPIDTWYAHSASLLGLFHTRALFCLSSFASWDSSAKEPYFWKYFSNLSALDMHTQRAYWSNWAESLNFWNSSAKEPYFGRGSFGILGLFRKRALFLEAFFEFVNTWYEQSASLQLELSWKPKFLGLFRKRALLMQGSIAPTI